MMSDHKTTTIGDGHIEDFDDPRRRAMLSRPGSTCHSRHRISPAAQGDSDQADDSGGLWQCCGRGCESASTRGLTHTLQENKVEAVRDFFNNFMFKILEGSTDIACIMTHHPRKVCQARDA